MTIFRLFVTGLLAALLVLEFAHIHQHALHQHAHMHQREAHMRQRAAHRHERAHVHQHRDAVPSPVRRTPVTADTVLVDITRSTVDGLLSETSLLSQARVVPSLHKGRVQGITLYAVRPGSLFAALGLQNGDTVLAVNGRAAHQPDCMPVHDVADPPDFLDISLLRDNRPLRMVVLIHDREGQT